MSTSTDAIYGWGIAFDEEGLGVEDHWDVSDEIQKRLGVSVFAHCHGEAQMLGFALCKKEANRGSPERVTQDGLPRTPGRLIREAIEMYIARLGEGLCEADKDTLRGVQDEELGWFICSYWG